MLAAMQHGPGPPGDLLERSVPYRDRPRGCTLKMSPSDLASRRYDRLWGSEEHFQEWLNIGGEPRNTSTNTSGYRRMHTPKSWLRGGEVIVEVGSHVGSDVIQFMRDAPGNVTVHTFEAVPTLQQILMVRVRQKVRQKGHRSIDFHSYAYGLGNTTRTSCFPAFNGTDIWIKSAGGDEQNAGDSRCVKAEIRDVVEVFADLSLRRVDLLQLNCEGCEYEVLERLSGVDGLLDGVREIEAQFHLDRGSQNETTRYCHIEDALRRSGFALAYRHPFLWERWERSGRRSIPLDPAAHPKQQRSLD